MTEIEARHRGEIAAYLTGFLTGRAPEHTDLVRVGLGLAETDAAEHEALDHAALALRTAEAMGSTAEQALPAAAALELVRSAFVLRAAIAAEEEAGRFAAEVWQPWGMPRTLNAADAMVSLAHLLVLELGASSLRAAGLLDDGLLALTEAMHGEPAGAGAVLAHLAVALGAVSAGRGYTWRADHGAEAVARELPSAARDAVLAGLRRVEGRRIA